MPDPLISVVLPVHNAARFVGAAVESILAQTCQDFEFLIYDDGSTDRSGDVLERYQSDARVRLVHLEKSGLIKTLNQGWRAACGKYIARMDADDIAVPERFAKQMAFLEAHPEVVVLGGAAQCINEYGDDIGQELRYPTSPADVRQALREYCPLVHPSTMIRRDALAAANGYRAAFLDAEDYDLWLRLAERHDLANLTDILIRYRVHSGQVSKRKLFQQTISRLGAQAAADCRRRTGSDPADQMTIMDISNLRQLGEPIEKIESTLCDLAEGSIMTLDAATRPKDAEEILALVADLLRRQGTPAGRARMAWTVARWSRLQGLRGESIRWALRACWADPAYIVKGLSRAANRIGKKRGVAAN